MRNDVNFPGRLLATVLHDVVWYAMVWYIEWYGITTPRHCGTWHGMVWEGILATVVQPLARKHSFLFLGLFQLLKSIIILNARYSIKFILLIQIQAKHDCIFSFKISSSPHHFHGRL